MAALDDELCVVTRRHGTRQEQEGERKEAAIEGAVEQGM